MIHSTPAELSTSVSGSAKSIQTKFDTYALIPELTLSCRLSLGVCHQPDVKLVGFRPWVGASHVSTYTEKLWYKETDCLWMSCWRSRDELIRDVLLWTPAHGCAKAGRPARTYIQQLCEDTGCCPEDLPRAMNDWEEWRERVRDIRATSVTWWWWWYISPFPLHINRLFSVHRGNRYGIVEYIYIANC